jgi:hypothetical protein
LLGSQSRSSFTKGDLVIQTLEGWITAWKGFIIPIISAVIVANQQYPIIPNAYLIIMVFVLASLTGINFTNPPTPTQEKK